MGIDLWRDKGGRILSGKTPRKTSRPFTKIQADLVVKGLREGKTFADIGRVLAKAENGILNCTGSRIRYTMNTMGGMEKFLTEHAPDLSPDERAAIVARYPKREQKNYED